MFETAELGQHIDDLTWEAHAPAVRESLLLAQQKLRQAHFPVIVLFAGPEKAGVGDTLNFLNSWMDPRGIRTLGFSVADDATRDRPAFWRYAHVLPAQGQTALFDGAWYHQPFRAFIQKRMTEETLDHELAEINAFEKLLVDGGALVLKFWLHLGATQQKARLEALAADPDRAWRVVPSDWVALKKHKQVVAAAAHMIAHTRFPDAPWHIVEGTDARYRELRVATLLRDALQRRLALAERAPEPPATLTPAVLPRSVSPSLRPTGDRSGNAPGIDELRPSPGRPSDLINADARSVSPSLRPTGDRSGNAPGIDELRPSPGRPSDLINADARSVSPSLRPTGDRSGNAPGIDELRPSPGRPSDLINADARSVSPSLRPTGDRSGNAPGIDELRPSPGRPSDLINADARSVLATVDLNHRVKKGDFAERLPRAQGRLARLQREAHARGVCTVLAFEGWDAAGKGGAIRHITAALDSRQYLAVPIAAPTEEERAHHYLWRFWRHLPPPGCVTIFDRTWYGRVLVERVEGFASPEAWGRAYSEINSFERALVRHGTVLAKFWLHVSPEEQEKRFRARAEVAYKQWKLTDDDWRNREKWPAYEAAVHDMVEHTSTRIAPWHLVGANDKEYARLEILRIVGDTLEAALEAPSEGKGA